MSVSRIVARIASPKKALTAAALAAATTGMVLTSAPAQAATTSSSSAQAIAHKMIPSAAQYNAFSKIVEHESGWNVTATNSSSGAYGLVQALPGSKMSSARLRLEDQRRHADQVGPGLHELPLRQPDGRLELLAVQRLVLITGSTHAPHSGGPGTPGPPLHCVHGREHTITVLRP